VNQPSESVGYFAPAELVEAGFDRPNQRGFDRLNQQGMRHVWSLFLAVTAVFLLSACRTTTSLPTAMPTAAVVQLSASPTPPATWTPLPSRTPTPTTPPTVTPTPTPCPPGEVIAGRYPSSIAGEMRYQIYLPPCYSQDGRTYPTLYLLPGNVHDETSWVSFGLVSAAEAAILAGKMPPLLLVMSDGGWIANNSSGGPGSFEMVVIDDLIPAIEQSYCAWPEAAGRALGGLSRGGYWSLMIAFRQPEQFVSVGGHSAALIDSHAGPDLNPQYTALRRDLGALRIYLDIGERDWLRPPLQKLHEDMAAAGIAHEWRLNPGEHGDDYWSSHVTDYLGWYAQPWPLDRHAYPICRP
jgi:enterochelin esterase-like enzyme